MSEMCFKNLTHVTNVGQNMQERLSDKRAELGQQAGLELSKELWKKGERPDR